MAESQVGRIHWIHFKGFGVDVWIYQPNAKNTRVKDRIIVYIKYGIWDIFL